MIAQPHSTRPAGNDKHGQLENYVFFSAEDNDVRTLSTNNYKTKGRPSGTGVTEFQGLIVVVLSRDDDEGQAKAAKLFKAYDKRKDVTSVFVTLPGLGKQFKTMNEWFSAPETSLQREVEKALDRAASPETPVSGRTKASSSSRRQPGPKVDPLDEEDTSSGDADPSLVTGDSATSAPPRDDTKSTAQVPYRETAGRLCQVHWSQKGQATDNPLCNFSASIIEQTVFDDGAEQTRRLRIKGALDSNDDLPEVDVTIGEFIRGDWPLTQWGCGAVVNAGMGVKDHLRAAIQTVSTKITYRTTYGHTGWRKLNGNQVYLHGGGAIGSNGSIDNVLVELPGALQYYNLPSPPTGTVRIAAVQASLGLLRGLAPDSVMLPLYATLCRSVLPDATFSTFLAGRTGTGKTELAALVQQHFGPEMNANRLPAHWSGTANALETIAFSAKDAILTVDDFCPTGAQSDVARTHKDADRLLRAQGNRSGRERLRADGTTKPVKPPRGTIVATGEDVPRGHSLRARVMITEVSTNDVDFKRLSECQRDAAAGTYALSMAAFIAWLAQRFDKVVERLKTETLLLRDQLALEDQHRRTPTIVAELVVSFGLFVEFAAEVGAISLDQAHELRDRCRSALLDHTYATLIS